MLQFKKKSQGAMEFMLTYGWAMLIVLVAIGALTYYGILDPTVLLPDKCTLQKGPLECTDQKIYIFSSANGQFHLKLANIFDNAVEVKSLKISREDFQCSYSGSIKTIAGGTEGCIPLFCENIPGTRKKQGFELEIKYSMPGGFEKILAGELYTTLRKPGYYAKGCPMPPGDGNGDGVINDADVLISRDYLLSRPPGETVFDYNAYDFNGDGVITAFDLTILNDIVSKCGCCKDESMKLDLAKQIKEKKISVNDLYSICSSECGVTMFSGCVPVEYVTPLRAYCRCCSQEDKTKIIDQINQEMGVDGVEAYCKTNLNCIQPPCPPPPPPPPEE